MSNKLFQLISIKYEKIKSDFSKSYKFATGENLNEDVFHNTLINCLELEKLDEMTESGILNYVYRAFRQNMLREKQYHRNKYTDSITEIIESKLIVSENFSTLYDYKKLMDYLEKTYSEELIELLFKWKIDNYSIRELEEITGIRGLNKKTK